MKKTYFSIIFILTFISSGFSQNESIKLLVKKTIELDLDMWDLTIFAEKHIKEKEQLARFFYYWIGSNIEYDDELLKKNEAGNLTNKEFWESQEEYKVYENRKGVCAGYANLFKWFMLEVDIEVIIISGHIRDQRNHYVELALDDDFRHAWNGIKINEKWMLVDSTWGMSNDLEVSDYYFNIDPKKFIITHFPENSKWQLLKKPLSLDDFNNSKFISPIWFKLGFTDIPKLKKDNENFYLVFTSNTNKNLTVNLLFSSDNRKFGLINNIKKIDQEGITYLKFSKNQTPEKAYFKINLLEFVML